MFPIPTKSIEELAAEGTTWAIAEMNRREIEKIKMRFIELDLERSRPLAAIVLEKQTPNDIKKLEDIELEAEQLRIKLADLKKEIT